MWIKICGLTTKEAVAAAINSGVSAVGFVFAPSKRRMSAVQALQLTQEVPITVLRVAVMQHPEQSLVDEVLSVFKPDVLQTDYQDFATLKIPDGLQRLPVLRAGSALPAPLPLNASTRTVGARSPAVTKAARSLAPMRGSAPYKRVVSAFQRQI